MKGDICRRMECSVCCHHTEMELTDADIDRISSLGHRGYYVEEGKARILRNVEGHCYFLKGDDCMIYHDKPRGCSLYPLIMAMPGKQPMMDEDCPHRHLFRFDPEEISELGRLIDELED